MAVDWGIPCHIKVIGPPDSGWLSIQQWAAEQLYNTTNLKIYQTVGRGYAGMWLV